MNQEEKRKIFEKTKQLTLLYVEDDFIIANSSLKLFKSIFKNTIYSKNGEEALSEFKTKEIDIIISDINMPRINGLDMARKIREFDQFVPIIFTTAHGESEFYKNAANLNIQGYLLKPIRVEDLFEKIGKAASKKIDIKEKNKNLNELKSINERLVEIAYKISSEKDYGKILDLILSSCIEISSCDGGTFYVFNEKEATLEFNYVLNDTLNIQRSFNENDSFIWEPLHFYKEGNNEVNYENIAVLSALQDRLICIDDIYESKEFDFTGVKTFDKENNYNTKSMLVLPVKNKDEELVGVIQLINKVKEGKFVPFSVEDKSLIRSVAALSTMTLDNHKLVSDLEKLLYALVSSIGTALGEKSAYTGKHVNNVADLALTIAKAVDEDDGVFKYTSFKEEKLEELKLAAWLHDIGKITTPEYIIDKATKLETIFDRIENIKIRFELLKKELFIDKLTSKIDEETYELKVSELESFFEFLKIINSGDVYMDEENQQKLDFIYNNLTVNINGKAQKVINDDEYYNLSIKKGTLTVQEREIINNHVKVSYSMLKEVPFPKKYKDVPKLAGSHHKTVNGKGYAHEDIINEPMSIGDKILAVADIFEALAAHDRPYRDSNTLSQIVRILYYMVKDNHLDKDIVKLFLEKKIYARFVEENFLPDQIDQIDIDIKEFDLL